MQRESLRRNSRPLQPISTDQQPQLHDITGIRAVLFDIYGTLFISGSGDIGTSATESRADAFCDALQVVGIKSDVDGTEGVECLRATIQSHHERLKSNGTDYPEVEIHDIWRDVLGELAGRVAIPDQEIRSDLLSRLAIEYEVRVNPVWPMPGALDCLTELSNRNLQLGIISNAQSFTPELFPALMDRTIAELGFSDSLCFFSFDHQRAKPGTFLFELAKAALDSECGIVPDEVIYVGNDMLNDVVAASRVGFRTALFAGDKRSLRMRASDARVDGIKPDLLLTHLDQLVECVTNGIARS